MGQPLHPEDRLTEGVMGDVVRTVGQETKQGRQFSWTGGAGQWAGQTIPSSRIQCEAALQSTV